jgi:hypothetical protein
MPPRFHQTSRRAHIYDPKIRFKIDRFIVPHLLDNDLDGRNSLETLFSFPFNHTTKSPQESHGEVVEKLKALEFPVLFLSNLKSVSFEAKGVAGRYTKEIVRKLEHGSITVQWLTLTLELNSEKSLLRLLVFTRNNAAGHSCSIGYASGEDGKLVPIDRPAFCFFSDQRSDEPELHPSCTVSSDRQP